MSFMEREITERMDWIEIDGPCGTEVIPTNVVPWDSVYAYKGELKEIPTSLRDYSENRKVWSITKVTGYGARLSAPGYLDCTDWAVFDTVLEAEDYLSEEYPEDEENTDDAL